MKPMRNETKLRNKDVQIYSNLSIRKVYLRIFVFLLCVEYLMKGENI